MQRSPDVGERTIPSVTTGSVSGPMRRPHLARTAGGAFLSAFLVAACGIGTPGVGQSPTPVPPGGSLEESRRTPSRSATPSGVPELAGWHVARTIDVPGNGCMTYGAGALWVVDRADGGFTGDLPNGDIYKVDPETGETLARIEHARGCFPTVGEGGLWLINAEFGQTVTRIDLETNEVTRFRSSDSEDPVPEAVVTTPGAVWVGNNHDGTVAKADAKTLKVLKTIRVVPSASDGGGGVRGGATTDGTSVWFPVTDTREIVRIDAQSAEIVSRMELPIVEHPDRPATADITDERLSAPVYLLVVGDRLYASSASHVYAIDISNPGAERIVADIPVEGWLVPVIGFSDRDSQTLWALQSEPTVLLKIDLAINRVVGRLLIPTAPDRTGLLQAQLAVLPDAIWLRVPGQMIELIES
jgi:hypothetical protein